MVKCIPSSYTFTLNHVSRKLELYELLLNYTSMDTAVIIVAMVMDMTIMMKQNFVRYHIWAHLAISSKALQSAEDNYDEGPSLKPFHTQQELMVLKLTHLYNKY